MLHNILAAVAAYQILLCLANAHNHLVPSSLQGIYDNVFVPCPNCGKEYCAQSKGSWDKSLREFKLRLAPVDVLADVNRHAPFKCERCGVYFMVDFLPQVVEVIPPVDS